MSIEAMVWAMNLAPVPYDKTKPNAACAAVLVGLANHADPDGRAAFPSTHTLVRYTRLSRRTVVTSIDRLVEAGIIVECDPEVIAAKIKRADQRPNGYDLQMDRFRDDLTVDELEQVAKSNPMLRGSVREILDGVQRLHPEAVTRGAASDARGAVDAERGATTAARGAAAAPEPTNNPSVQPSPEPAPSGGKPPAAEKGAKATRGTRLPDGWQPDEELRQWFREQPFARVVKPVEETQRFIDHFRAAPGQRGVKIDWAATWRNWMRTAADRAGGRAGSGANRRAAPQHPQVSEAHADRVGAMFGGRS